MKSGYANDGQQPYEKIITDQDNNYSIKLERNRNKDYYKLGFRSKQPCTKCGFYACRCGHMNVRRKLLSMVRCEYQRQCGNWNLYKCAEKKTCMRYWTFKEG